MGIIQSNPVFQRIMPKKTPIDTLKHKDKRANIPTEETRDFITEEQKQPQPVLYPRDASLDPQLVWKGKDIQDSQDLDVSALPIYIQEKIHPQAIIDDFRTQVKEEQEQQLNLFGDFNGLEFEKLIDFYQHKDGVKWTNRMILGDSLLVMNSLSEKEGLKGKVQMIYLDPPYGIKFGSNWQVSTRKRDVKDGKLEEVTRQPEQVKAFRDTWELGIHSYLSYLRDRLVVARELLTETGSIFVQIGDENVHLVRCLMDEVFGSENFVSKITFQKTSYQETKYLANVCDYILWYGKEKEKTKIRHLYYEKIEGNSIKLYKYARNKIGEIFNLSRYQYENTETLPNDWQKFKMSDITSSGRTETGSQPLKFKNRLYELKGNLHWKTNNQGLLKLEKANRIAISGNSLAFIKLLDDYSFSPISNIWNDTITGGFAEPRTYVVQTIPKVIQRCILMATDPGDLVLDPTMGSATTAYVAEQWGRRWITIDTSRVSLALARTRLMSALFPYYMLSDSPEGIQKEAEITGQSSTPCREVTADIKKGFVYKRVPHVTLKAIANNPEIDLIYDKYQQQLEPILKQLNQLLKKSWEEWEIPRDNSEKWTQETKDLLEKWWHLKRDRQQKIDDSIARNADYELLYDQPYEDKKRIRVTGPFTVESLSPHRVLPTLDNSPISELEGTKHASEQFEIRIIENLKKAGVQNTKKSERLQFDNLESFAGTWIQATGEYTETDGTRKRVAISIGPEYGTVSAEQIKESAKEAVQGLGYNLLIVCGFAFDPGVTEESKRYGKLQVLITRMNTDLLLGDNVLKKTGSANLFLVFGEPDIDITQQDDGKITVELKGLDIYDPTTGEIRSSSVDDIACWFIDTHYNSESFFVRHAYFTGANSPYEKLKRTLKAEIDEETWQSFYSSVSRPFNPPIRNGKTGKKDCD